MTSSRSPGTMTRLRGPMRSSMCSGSIAPMATPPMTWSRSGPGWSVSPWTPSRTMARVGFDRIGRYGSTPSSGMPWRARPCSRVRARPGFASRSTLFTMAPGDVHALALEERGVEDDLVDRPADAALGHDDRRRPEHRGDRGVGQADDGARRPAWPVPSMSRMSRSPRRRRGPSGSARRGPRRPGPRCRPG